MKAFEIIIPVLALIEPSLADLILEELVGVVVGRIKKLKEAWRTLGLSTESPFMTMLKTITNSAIKAEGDE